MAHDTHPDAHGDHAEHGGHHIFDDKVLKKTFFVLVGLTFLTVVLALWERGFANVFGLEFEFPALPVGWLSVPIALGIAGTKAYWVASRFMGLKYEGGTNALIFVVSIVFLLIFFGFTYLDFAFRDTFFEQSAVTTDIFEEQSLTAEEEEARIREAYEAAPLVREPDPELFGNPAPEAAPASGEGAPDPAGAVAD